MDMKRFIEEAKKVKEHCIHTDCNKCCFTLADLECRISDIPGTWKLSEDENDME